MHGCLLQVEALYFGVLVCCRVCRAGQIGSCAQWQRINRDRRWSSVVGSMFRGIYERFLDCVVLLVRMGQSLIQPFQSAISRVRSLSWKDFSKGFSFDFGLTLLILGLIASYVWGFDYIDRLQDRIVMTLLPAVLPLLAFSVAMRQERKERRVDWWYVGFAVFLGLVLALAVSDKFDLDAVGINVVVIMVSSPWLVIFWTLVRQKRILAIGMVSTAVLLMVSWFVPAFSSDLELGYLLVPLPAFALVVAAWTILVWIFLKGIDKWSDHPTLGPLMESLAMLFLFMPLMVLAIWLPKTIPSGDDWSVVPATIVGVVFGSVISEPMRRFLSSYGNLPSHSICAGGNESVQSQNTGKCGREWDCQS